MEGRGGEVSQKGEREKVERERGRKREKNSLFLFEVLIDVGWSMKKKKYPSRRTPFLREVFFHAFLSVVCDFLS